MKKQQPHPPAQWFIDQVREAKAIVAKWPAWKKAAAGIEDDDAAILDANTPEIAAARDALKGLD